MFSEYSMQTGLMVSFVWERWDSSHFMECSILKPLKGLSILTLSNAAFSKLIWPWNPFHFKHSVPGVLPGEPPGAPGQ